MLGSLFGIIKRIIGKDPKVYFRLRFGFAVIMYSRIAYHLTRLYLIADLDGYAAVLVQCGISRIQFIVMLYHYRRSNIYRSARDPDIYHLAVGNGIHCLSPHRIKRRLTGTGYL